MVGAHVLLVIQKITSLQQPNPRTVRVLPFLGYRLLNTPAT